MRSVSSWVWAVLSCEVGADIALFQMPDGKFVSSFSGKMNVPEYPAKTPNGNAKDCINDNGDPSVCWVSFWPAIEPSGLLYQPFLINRSPANGEWHMGMQYWGCGDTGSTETCSCYSAGYCDRAESDDSTYGHDYVPVKVGDTISWHINLISNSTRDNLWYEMGWSSTGGAQQSLIGKANHGGKVVGVLYEGGPQNNRANWGYFPRSDLRFWDLKLLDDDGQRVSLDWSQCDSGKGPTFDCSESEIRVQFPGASPDSSCEDKCASAGHCCSGGDSSFQHPSCAMGCIVSKHTGSVDECQAKCLENDNTCDHWYSGGEEFRNCNECPSGCDASGGVQECLDGCTYGFSSRNGLETQV